MIDSEVIAMMQRCRDEIMSLRAQIDRLTPRAQAYDDISTLLRAAIPRPSQGMGEDVAWMLDKRIREIERAQEQEKKAAAEAASEGEQA